MQCFGKVRARLLPNSRILCYKIKDIALYPNCIGLLRQTVLSLFTQVDQSGVFQIGLLVYEDCRLHHERKDMQLEKIPKWNVNNEGTQYISMDDTQKYST